MSISAYFHPSGTPQAPKHSEYEIEMSGVWKIMTTENGKLKDGRFLQVVDEEKPVFAVIHNVEHHQIWRFDDHLKEGKKRSHRLDATPVVSSSAEAMLTQSDSYSYLLLSIRVGDEKYYAGDTAKVKGEFKAISLDDLLEFISGEISWEQLRGKSHLFEKKVAKEISCQKKNIELANKLSHEKEKTGDLTNKVQTLEVDLKSTNEKLDKVPNIIKKAWSAI